ncbi:hypothetical protein GCM10010430_53140 [Kitasatospora cystarginea]|uniref:Protein kinase domain-containing protein n=1 Tax=Kitasatospora cystarginea TaxID=58350 RepID=A0ABN3ELS1_9ACTN
MADGTKAVVDTSVADEAALAMALGDIPSDTSGEQPGGDLDGTAKGTGDTKGSEAGRPAKNGQAARSDGPAGAGTGSGRTEPAKSTGVGESAAPLSSAEIAAELAAGAAALAAAAKETADEINEAAASAAKGSAKPAAASAAKGSAKPAAASTPKPGGTPSPAASAQSTATPAAGGTGQLPAALPAPLRHSGDKIAGRYRLEECIGQSESFSSWRAVDEKLRRAVGVHLLAAGHQRAKAVLAAAKSAALLGDPRFVQVLDAVQEGELVYVIREWLPDATDLAKLLAAGPMEPYDAYQMVRQVTDAITAAHRRGQAHLRLTPRCVLRTESGQYRINGIAVDAALRGLTSEDAERTDTRAIGVLLYAALTHRWPFPEDRYDLQGLPKSLGCVPPDQVKAGVHKGLAELATRALCEPLPHNLEPITSPEELAKAIALMPRIRQPEPPAPPAFTPRYGNPRPAQPQNRPSRPDGGQPNNARPLDTERIPPRPARQHRGLRTFAKWTASLVALAAIGTGSWQLVSTLHHQTDRGTVAAGTSPSSAPSNSAGGSTASAGADDGGKPIRITGVTSFNPYGDPEHTPELPKAIDGDPSTSWPTSGYFDNVGGAYKPGTGLMVDLGSAQRVTSVHVQFVGSTKVELRAAPKDTSTAPTVAKDTLNSVFGQPVDSGQGVSVDLKPQKPLTTRYLLIWLTSLPQDTDGRYQGRIAEVQVSG